MPAVLGRKSNGRSDICEPGVMLYALPAAMTRQALTNHFAGQNVKGGKQRGGAVPLLAVSLPLGQTGSQRLKRSGTVQSLDLALLIHAEHRSAIRRIQIQAYHVAHFLSKCRSLESLNFSTRCGQKSVVRSSSSRRWQLQSSTTHIFDQDCSPS